MVRSTVIAVLLVGMYLPMVAQKTIQPKQIDYSMRGVLYKQEKSFDLQVHTNGIAFGYNAGEIRKYYLTRFYHVDVGILKHPKEYRQSVNNTGGSFLLKSSNAFAYGKQNSLLVLRAGIGEKRYFSEKARRKGIAVGISYEGGLTLGLQKPYYLNLNRTGPLGEAQIVAEKYSEENHDIFLDVNKVYGSASFFKGFNEIKILPGIHGKIAGHFALGAFDEMVKAMEIGIMFDVFFTKVPIMIIEDNQPFFVNGYIILQLGKRK
jgi:hypothetical protein